MESNFVVLGLPASGKTTFLAALWHLVEAGEIPSRLKLDSYKGDFTYLNLIAQAWRTFTKVPRTSQHGDVDVTFHLVDRQTGVKGTAFFPDLAGESFDTQVESRRCRPDFTASVKDDDGLLFFISANVKGEALSVVELNAVMPAKPLAEAPVLAPSDALFQDELPETATKVEASLDEKAKAGLEEWTAKKVPTQVRIVQILSDILRPPFHPRLRRLAVIISAWDLTDGKDISPQSWIDTNMPLVGQFLKTNTASFNSRIYGISAQGVDLDNKVAVEQVAQEAQASLRIQVVGPNEDGHDLTAPLAWLMAKD